MNEQAGVVNSAGMTGPFWHASNHWQILTALYTPTSFFFLIDGGVILLHKVLELLGFWPFKFLADKNPSYYP